MTGGGASGPQLEETTSTFAIAFSLFLFVAISVALERGLHYLGHWLEHTHREDLNTVVDNFKDELMLLGFISLMLGILQPKISSICASPESTWLLCKKSAQEAALAEAAAAAHGSTTTGEHGTPTTSSGGHGTASAPSAEHGTTTPSADHGTAAAPSAEHSTTTPSADHGTAAAPSAEHSTAPTTGHDTAPAPTADHGTTTTPAAEHATAPAAAHASAPVTEAHAVAAAPAAAHAAPVATASHVEADATSEDAPRQLARRYLEDVAVKRTMYPGLAHAELFGYARQFSYDMDLEYGHKHIIPFAAFRRRLSGGAAVNTCPNGEQPFVSATSMHELHVFIFILACTHVVLSCLAMLLATSKVRRWAAWEMEVNTGLREKKAKENAKKGGVAEAAAAQQKAEEEAAAAAAEGPVETGKEHDARIEQEYSHKFIRRHLTFFHKTGTIKGTAKPKMKKAGSKSLLGSKKGVEEEAAAAAAAIEEIKAEEAADEVAENESKVLDKNGDLTEALKGLGHVKFRTTYMALVLAKCFFDQFFKMLSEADYIALREEFIRGNRLPKSYNFHGYLTRTMHHDFSKVIGVSWWLWLLFVIIMLFDVAGWNLLFWITLATLMLSLVIGTKLQFVLKVLALHHVQRLAAKSEENADATKKLFWFNKPSIILQFIQFFLFEISLGVSIVIWTLIYSNSVSCSGSSETLTIIFFVLCFVILGLCSYITLPLYALVTQMGGKKLKSLLSDKALTGIKAWKKTGTAKAAEAASPAPGGSADHSRKNSLSHILSKHSE